MFSPKKIAEMSSKNMFVLPRAKSRSNLSPFSRSQAPIKGHLVIYTIDEEELYEVPLSCLNNHVIKELFEDGRSGDGLEIDRPITMPCNSLLMDYILSMVGKQTSSEVEALFVSMASVSCSWFSLLKQGKICGYQFMYIASR